MAQADPRRRISHTLADWQAWREQQGAAEQAIEHLVIGSGYGGSVAARRLAEAGREVVLLERGSEFLPGEFANDVSLLPKFLRGPALRGPGVSGSPNGLFEWHLGDKVAALVANGLGGGSLINAGVLFEPDGDVLRQAAWPAALRQEAGDGPARAFSLRDAFGRARAGLGDHRWPDGETLPKTRSFTRLAPFLAPGASAEAVQVTIDPALCTRCGDCCSGCNQAGAKLTLRDRYLLPAVAAGATLVCGATAWRIEPLVDAELIDELDPAAPRWRITVLDTGGIATHGSPARAAASREALVLTARHVVLAAGTFGSTELLQRSQALAGERFALSPALGTRFSGNGDALSFVADLPEAVHAEGHGAVADQPPVGPTITAVADLRRHGEGPRAGELRPIEERVIVEDGAVPGAIARFTREMLATQYLMAQLNHMRWRRLRAGAAADTLAAGPFGAHTQVLLAMGHDGSRGRIVRLAERDRSVPWWPDDPATLATYRRQADAYQGAEDRGGVHLHPPTWQFLPRAAGSLMSGPKPPRLMLTVHPLGGCPMGDRFADGVVDGRGRVWRAEGRLWPGLAVLDGAILPTSMGVNPLLTITALAERALALALAEPDPIPARATAIAPPRPTTTPLPRAFARQTAADFDISLFERLTCPPERLKMRGERRQHAEVRLELGASEWLKVWDEPRHRVQARGGRMRLQAPVSAPVSAPVGASAGSSPLRPATTLDYRVESGWFELLPQGSTPLHRPPRDARTKPRQRGTFIDEGRRLLRCCQEAAWAAASLLRPRLWLTWCFSRGREDWQRASAAGQRFERPFEAFIELARSLGHAAERRQMRYRLELARCDLPGPGRDDAGPARLRLLGRKDIGYAASWTQLARWVWRHSAAAWRGQGVPPPRPSYWAQITNPQLVLLDAEAGALREWLAWRWPRLARAYAWGRFEVDAAQLLAQAPLLLHRGDLTNGVEAQSAYGWLFLRHALKTHVSDLRAPDYSGRPVADPRGDGDVLTVNGRAIHPELHRLSVRRGRSEGEALDRPLPNRLELDLWHYRRPAPSAAPMLRRDRWYGQPVWRARSVLLVHAFGQSGAMYTLDEPHPSLARSFLAEGFDVWVLDHRISTRLPYTDWPSTIDQIARFDLPAAVRHIREEIAREHLGPDAQTEPLQIFAFAQCIGGAALAMALLDGRLSLDIGAALKGAANGPRPMMPMLAGAVISQTHPFLVGAPLTRAKTWLPALLRDALGGGAVPLAVRGPVDSLPEAWLDRALAALPVPDDEHCPGDRDPRNAQDDCATCRRIRFIEAPLFKHRNLSLAMHALLPRLFGNANLHLFAHAAHCVEHERLVDNDGRSVYVRDDRWRAHFGLPVAFLHGQDNELFDVASARRSAAEHARLYPDMAQRVARALDRNPAPSASAAAWVLPGFGHVDPVIGEAAPRLVFEPMARLFDRLWLDEGDAAAPATRIRCAASMPRAGPWIGHVQPLPAKRLRVHLAFHLDDRYSGGKNGSDGEAGTRSAAFVRVGRGAAARLHRLRIEGFLGREELRLNGDGGDGNERTVAVAGYRCAWGAIEVERPPAGEPLLLRAFSVHEMLEAPGYDSRGATLEVPASARLFDIAAAPNAELATWSTCLLAGHARTTRRMARRRDWLDPAWRQVSRQAGERCDALRHVARIAPAVLDALCAARHDAPISFAAASCRYPGMAVDAPRVDESARQLVEAATQPQPGRAAPAFALLLGDQIYADATAGVVDSLNPVERYVQRHREAFAQGLRSAWGAPQPGLGELLAQVPTYLTQDDHELRDGWPGSGPLQNGLEQGRARDKRLVRIALDALHAFQRLHMPSPVGAPGSGSYCFEQGPLRVFVLDTRTEREVMPRCSINVATTLRALRSWLSCTDADGRLNCLVSGSVLLPRLAPGSNPADPGEDSMAWCDEQRLELLALLHEAARLGRRFLLLSGDYHLSAALRVMQAGRAIGAAVVAPPLYAPLPYTNAPRDALWIDEPLPHGLSLQSVGTADGSGFATLTVHPERDGGYTVAIGGWRRDHAEAEAEGRFEQRWTLRID